MDGKSRKKGRLFIISAPSGTGKTTLCRRLLSEFPDMSYSVSCTTRPPRPGETEGQDYYFVSTDEFEQMIREARLAEWAEVHGNYYGTSADLLESELEAGRDVLLDIDVNGARQIISRFPQSVTIFIMPPSMEALRKRLEKRGTDDPDVMEDRLKSAAREMEARHEYSHVIVNEDLDEALQQLILLVRQYRQ